MRWCYQNTIKFMWDESRYKSVREVRSRQAAGRSETEVRARHGSAAGCADLLDVVVQPGQGARKAKPYVSYQSE